MSTLISDFRTPIRAVMGDFNSVIRKYQDTAIDDVVKLVVRSGRLPGFALNVAGDGITPDVNTGRNYGLLVYRAALAFVAPASGSYSYRTRALAESFGDQRNFLNELHDALQEIDGEGGAMFASDLGFRSWFLGVARVDPWASLVDMTVSAPVATVNIGQSGLTVSS